jgi:hypothetical protein
MTAAICVRSVTPVTTSGARKSPVTTSTAWLSRSKLGYAGFVAFPLGEDPLERLAHTLDVAAVHRARRTFEAVRLAKDGLN